MTGASIASPPSPRDIVLGALFVAGAIAVVAVPRFLHGPIWGDEGFLALGAERVLQGQIPNRDFVSLQPPLSFYVVAAAFAAFGTNLVVLRSLGLALALAVGLAGYALALRYARPATAALATAPLAVCGLALQKYVPFAVWFGVLFSLLAGALLLAAARRGRLAWAAAAGVCTALALLSRHDQGFYLCLASALFLALRGLARGKAPLPPDPMEAADPGARPLGLAWLAGLGTASLPPLALWLATGSFAPAFEQLVVFPLTRYAETSAIEWPGLGARGAWLPTLFYYAPLAAIAGLAVDCVRRFRARGPADARLAERGFLLVLTALFYAQVATRSDLFHLVIALPPCFVALAHGFESLRGALRRRFSDAAAIGLLIGLSGALIGLTAPHFLAPLEEDARPVDVPRGGVWLSEFEAQRIERLARFAARRVPEDASVLALPYQPIVNFLLDRRSPTRWLYLWPGDQTQVDHARLIAEAEADPPALVILDRPERLRGYAPELVAWVEARYAPIATVRASVYFAPRAEASADGGATP